MTDNTDNTDIASKKLSEKMTDDVKEFLFNITEGDADTALVIMAMSELFYRNPRLASLVARFQMDLREAHVAQSGHIECGTDAYAADMWESINKALPFNSDVRDYIDFVVD